MASPLARPHIPAALRPAMRRFTHAADGVMAVEFAVLVPVLLILLLGTVEIARAWRASSQLTKLVAMQGQMVSQLPGASTVAEVQDIWASAPQIMTEAARSARAAGGTTWGDALDITITNVVFTRRDSNCTFWYCARDPVVAWSVGMTPAACGPVTMAWDARSESATKPRWIGASSASAVFVFARLRYAPIITSRYFKTLTLSESVWLSPRNTDQIKLSGSAASAPSVRLCPGYN